MRKITLVIAAFLTSLTASAQIPGMTGLYTFSDQDDLFANTAPGDAGTGLMKCDGVMKFDPESEDTSADDMPSEELTDWRVINGIKDKAIFMKAFNWLKIWHGIPANGGGSYVNDFSVLVDVRLSCDTCKYSLLEVNPTPKSAGYESEMEIDNLKLGSVDLPWSTDGIPFSEFILETEKWYRIAYVAKLGEYIRMYVNGEEWNSWEGNILDGRPAPYGADSSPSSAAMKIGGNNEQYPDNNPQRDYDKDIDAVALFEAALTTDELTALGGPENDILSIVTGQETRESTIEGFTVYPNPASRTISLSGGDLQHMEIISLSGVLLDRMEITQGGQSIDISHLTKGMYLLRVWDINQNLAVDKLVVE